MIYLDHNATTRPSPAVVKAVTGALARFWENPSSIHRAGQRVRREVDLARAAVAALIGAKPAEITFTSGGTESIDLAMRGVLGAKKEAALITTRIEHPAVREVAEDLARAGRRVRWLALRAGGPVDLSDLRAALSEVGPSPLVSVQWANNETGALQPVREIARICRDAGARYHCDATQVVGKLPVDVAALGADAISFAPHKFHGPKGVGVLWTAKGVRLRPVLLGTQELGRRGGTENVPGILGAAEAAREAVVWLENPQAREAQRALRDDLERRVLDAVPDAVINAPPDLGDRLWNTSSIGFPGLAAEALLLVLSERGLCVSAGAACSSGSLEPSPVLLAMGIPEPIAHGTIRLSLARDTTRAEVEEACRIVADAVRTLRASSGNLPAARE